MKHYVNKGKQQDKLSLGQCSKLNTWPTKEKPSFFFFPRAFNVGLFNTFHEKISNRSTETKLVALLLSWHFLLLFTYLKLFELKPDNILAVRANYIVENSILQHKDVKKQSSCDFLSAKLPKRTQNKPQKNLMWNTWFFKLLLGFHNKIISKNVSWASFKNQF